MPAVRDAAEPGGGWFRLVLPFTLAALVAVMALPRLAAAVAELPARAVLEALRRGELRSLPGLRAAASAAEAGLAWRESAELWNGLALLRQHQAQLAGLDLPGGPAQALLADAAAASVRALALAPADGYAWGRLAEARLALHGPAAAAPAFARDLALASNDLGRLWQQVDLGLTLWTTLAAPEREALGLRFLQAGRRNPHLLAWMAARRHGLGPVRDALAREAGLLSRFDAAYRGRRL